MANAPILIVGGTGTVGSELVRRLALSEHRVRVLTRDPARAAERLPPSVEIVAGDLEDPRSLLPALRNVEVASLATTPTPQLGVQEVNFIEAAAAAKLRRVVKLSGFGIDFAVDRIHLGHAESERRLRASGIPFVVLRPVVFMANLLMDVEAIKAGRLPSVFGDSAMSFVDPGDVAELMSLALVDPRYDGETWEFGGPEPLTYDQLAATLTRVLRRRVEHVSVDPAQFSEQALRAGVPDFVVEAVLQAAVDTRKGKYLVDDAVVQRVLGRRARPFSDWLERHHQAFVA